MWIIFEDYKLYSWYKKKYISYINNKKPLFFNTSYVIYLASKLLVINLFYFNKKDLNYFFSKINYQNIELNTYYKLCP